MARVNTPGPKAAGARARRISPSPAINISRTPFQGKSLIYWQSGKEGIQKRDAIDTDQIIPSEHCVSADLADLWKPWGEHVFAHMDPQFRQKVGGGQTFIIAGERFGCGSSREMAPAGLLRAAKDMGQEGKLVIIAKSIDRIFRKNAINLGLHICECPQAVDDAKEGNEFEFDPISRKLKNLTQGREYNPLPLTPQEERIRLGGGLVGAAKKNFSAAQTRRADRETIAARFPTEAEAKRMSLAEQILYAHRVNPRDKVEPRQTVEVFTDLLPACDGTAPFAISVFLEVTGNSDAAPPWNAAIVNDHFFPCTTPDEEAQYQLGKRFAGRFGLKYPHFTKPRDGIFHFHFPHSGLVLPGMVIPGADSHTCTYGAYGAFGTGVGSTELGVSWALKSTPITFSHNRRVTFRGALQPWVTGKDVILQLLALWGMKGVEGACLDMLDPERQLSMADRHTIANMAVEGNALSAIFPQDEVTDRFFASIGVETFPYPRLQPGSDAGYKEVYEVDLGSLKPMAARPPHPSNGVWAQQLASERVSIAQAYLGSCTNGSYQDMRQAALVINASGQQRLSAGVRMIVFPGDLGVLDKMQQPEPLLDGKSVYQILSSVGADIRLPACGHCFKPTADSPRPGEVIVSTTNRNWENRQGKGVQTYLASPFTAAASAMLGYIGTPQDAGAAWQESFRA